MMKECQGRIVSFLNKRIACDWKLDSTVISKFVFWVVVGSWVFLPPLAVLQSSIHFSSVPRTSLIQGKGCITSFCYS